MNRTWVFAALLFLMSCQVSDEKKIIGRWQSDDVWYEYLNNNTYNSGRSIITMIKGYKYSIDVKKKELTMYTEDPNQTYYLQYQFKGTDTLMLNNVLNSNPHFVAFYKAEKK